MPEIPTWPPAPPPPTTNPPPATNDEAAVDGAIWEPIDVNTARAARDSFDWNNTTPLNEESDFSYTADGLNTALPPLRYAQIYVKNADQLRELEEMGIHYNTTPLFDSEWPSDSSVVTIPAGGDDDDAGAMFVFALIPTPVYNAIREEALAGEDTYDALILRDVPAEAAASDGTVSWQYVLDNTEAWAPISSELTDDGEVVLPLEEGDAPEQKRLGRRLRRALRKVANAVRGVVDAVRQVIAVHANVFLKSKTITIATKVNDRTLAPLVRAWDDGVGGFGKRLQLEGLRVNVTGRSRLTLYKAKLGRDGVARVEVPENIKVNVCFEADSPAAKFEQGVIVPVLHCWLKQDPEKDFNGTPRAVGDTEFYSMAQVIDARAYAESVLGFRPPKVTIQVGWLAEVLGYETGAFVPCLAATKAPVSMANAYADVLNAAGAFAGTTLIGAPIPIGMIVEFGASTDIVLTKRARTSRNTVVHEYGHFFFCSLLANTNPNAYNTVWSQVIAPQNLIDKASTPVKALNEGIADWFASQVAGSVNYMAPLGATQDEVDGNFFIDHNAPGAGQGLEMNYGGPACSDVGCDTMSPLLSDKGRVVSKVVSIMHDAIDRADCGGDASCRAARRSDGAPWVIAGNGSKFTTEDPFTITDIGDEEIALSPADIRQSMVDFARKDFLGAPLSYENFYGALANTMRRDHTEEQICKLFALHETDGSCAFGSPTPPPVVEPPVVEPPVVEPPVVIPPPVVQPPPPPVATFTVNAGATPGGSVTPPSTVVESGGSVTLVATASPGYRFTGYTGGGQCAGDNPQLTISGVTSDVGCTANFVRQVRVAYASEGNGVLSISGVAQPSGWACIGDCITDVGSSVTLTVNVNAYNYVDRWTCTDTNSGFRFDTSSQADPALLTLNNLQTDWSCLVTVFPYVI